MKQRGRKTALSVVQGGAVSAVDRPEPLSELTNEQRIEWVLVVNSLPADWFPAETHGVLAQYCRHVVLARHLSALIDNLESDNKLDIDAYGKLVRLQDTVTGRLLSCATKMRITQQSSYHPEKLKPTQIIDNPWEDE